MCCAHHHGFQLCVIINTSYVLVVVQHPLVTQKPKRQIVRVIPNRHGRDNFLPIQKNGKRAFFDHGYLGPGTGLVMPHNTADQARRFWVW